MLLVGTTCGLFYTSQTQAQSSSRAPICENRTYNPWYQFNSTNCTQRMPNQPWCYFSISGRQVISTTRVSDAPAGACQQVQGGAVATTIYSGMSCLP